MFFHKKDQATIATLFHEGMQEVLFRLSCDVPRTHSTSRAADILSRKGNLCYYVDRAWDMAYQFIRYSWLYCTSLFDHCIW
jgi:hypothetical protein